MSEQPAMPTVVIVDDHPVVLHGLKDLLSISCRVLRACGDGDSAIAAITELAPDVAILDVSMPGLGGIQVLQRLREEGDRTAVLFLTATISDDQVASALALGANGILLKESIADELAQQVLRVSRGERCIPAWAEEAARRSAARRAEADRLRRLLTPREREILVLLTRDLSNKALARQLGLTDGTVKLHIHNIYGKLGVSSRAALLDLALGLRDLL